MNINVPVSWLKEYLKTDVAAKTLAKNLTLSGPSVEKIMRQGDDYIFDIEVTTNRSDAYSIFGIARESHAILQAQNLNSKLQNPKGLNIKLDPDSSKLLPLDVVIKSNNLCPRFSAVVVDNVKIGQSPAYIRNRLEASGVRAINNIVDISNYIMLELGQPMHTFDYDKIKGFKMILRKSQKFETIKTLDGISHKIPEGSIIIEDEERIIDLCGIMGGANSAVNSRTKRVVLFVQAYNSHSIRRTTQELAFKTEASSRFEKGIDIDGMLPALSRAVYLAKETAGAIIASELIDIYPKKQPSKTYRLKTDKLNDYLGMQFEPSKAIQILKSLGFEAQLFPKQITAQTPSYRNQDIESDVDLIEEIARIYGYHNLPSKLPSGELPQTNDGVLKKVIHLKNALKYLGLTETISYSIISRSLLKISGKSQSSVVELSNPLTEEWQYMRPTLIPSLLEVISKNKNIKENLKVFEIAKTYIPRRENLPKQDFMLSLCIAKSNFYDTKGLLENIFETLKYKIRLKKLATKHQLFQESGSAIIKIGDDQIGVIGNIKPTILNTLDIKSSVTAVELNLTNIYKIPPISNSYTPVPKYPPVVEDISIVIAQALPLAELIDEIKKAGSPLLKMISAVDTFEDPKFGENKKSVTLRLIFQKSTGTPTLEESNEVKKKIISSIEKIFRAKIR